MPVPVVEFTDERLPNGLRLIVAEDHLAPVVAVNIWYNVGSKHEVPGKTGFAHLFEHVMFQGSAHVGKAEHMALVQAAGGTLNGTTWLDRTNYYETMPSHQLELAIYLEADRMGSLLDALSQENLDNQREVVKNEKRWSYDNRPYGTWNEKLLAQLYPEDHPYHHPTIGSMADLDAASLDDVKDFFRTYYAPNNAVLSVVGDCDRAQVRAWADKYFGPIPANDALPPQPDLSMPALIGEERRETVEDRVPLPRVYIAFRAPVFGDRRLDALDIASQILAGGKGSRLHKRLVREERLAQDVAVFTLPFVGGASINVGWVTVRPGVDIAVGGGRLSRGARATGVGAAERGRARTGQGAHGGRRARRARAGGGARGPPVDVRDPVRRPGLHQHAAAALPVRDRGADPRRRAGGVPRRQPGGADLRPGRRRGPRRRVRRGGGMSAPELIAERPVPGQPRAYDFPTTVRTTLANGLRVIVTPMPGRALIAASVVLRTGAGDEPDDLGGATVLAARALTEGTEVRDAVALTEAGRAPWRLAARGGRLGRDVRRARRAGEPARCPRSSCWRRSCAGRHSPSGRSTACVTSASPTSSRRRPIRAAAPRRRSSPRSTLPSSPYRRPAGGTADTVKGLTAAELRAVHDRAIDPAAQRDRPRRGARRGRRDPRRRGPVRRLGRRSVRVDARPHRRHLGHRRPVRATSSIARGPSRPRSGSGTRRCRGGTRTSTPCR